jgi:hypothetical protein
LYISEVYPKKETEYSLRNVVLNKKNGRFVMSKNMTVVY